MASRFLTPLAVERTRHGAWRLTSALFFESESLNLTVNVPAGFETDFASVPRLPLAYWLFGGVADEAAVVHDWLYSSGQVTRKQADEVFAEASKACGVPAWRRLPMFWGVRLFGGSRYSAQQLLS